MTIGELKDMLEVFAEDSDAEIKVETENGWVNVTSVSFHNDVNTLLIEMEETPLLPGLFP